MALQGVALLVIVFGDIGFDRPGRFGLDFGHLMFFALLWFGASCVGFMLAWGMQQSGPLKLQSLLFSLAASGWLIAILPR